MFKYWKSLVFLILTLIIVAGAVCFPRLFFTIQDAQMMAAAHSRQEIHAKLAPEAEEIYLVNAIRDIYHNNQYFDYGGGYNYPLSIDDSPFSSTIDSLNEQLDIMTDQSALDMDLLNSFHYMIDPMIWVNGTYGIWEDKETPFSFYTIYDDAFIANGFVDIAPQLSFYMEPKTGKVLYLRMFTEQRETLKIAPRENINAYIRYLGLDVLDDWTYQPQGAMSEKAQLKIIYMQNDTEYYIQILPVGYYFYDPYLRYRDINSSGAGSTIDSYIENNSAYSAQ